jgi:hypothetical protein
MSCYGYLLMLRTGMWTVFMKIMMIAVMTTMF